MSRSTCACAGSYRAVSPRAGCRTWSPRSSGSRTGTSARCSRRRVRSVEVDHERCVRFHSADVRGFAHVPMTARVR
jgi:hypothetical protein